MEILIWFNWQLTDDEAEAPILWPLDAKSWLSGKDRDAGKGWGQEEKLVVEDEMFGWHHWLNCAWVWADSISVSCSVMSNSLWPHWLWPTRLLCPWYFPGKNTGVYCHFLLQGIFLTQGSNLGLLHCRQILYHLSHREAQEIVKDRGACRDAIHRVAKNWTWVSDWTTTTTQSPTSQLWLSSENTAYSPVHLIVLHRNLNFLTKCNGR